MRPTWFANVEFALAALLFDQPIHHWSVVNGVLDLQPSPVRPQHWLIHASILPPAVGVASPKIKTQQIYSFFSKILLKSAIYAKRILKISQHPYLMQSSSKCSNQV